MKKILIALDYGPTATEVAKAGLSLAKGMVAEVLLLHVISDPGYYASTAYSPVMGFSGFSSLDYMKPDILTTVRSTAQEFLDKSKRQLGDETAEVLIKEGDAADCIKEAATEQKADIIVMGSHSRKWLDSILMGSTVAKVLHDTAVPLYIFPTRKHN